MKHVQIVAFCDGDHEIQEPATVERKVSLDGGPTVVVDLCETHDKVFVELADFLSERGSTEADQPSANRPFKRRGSKGSATCPTCGFTSKSREALGQHTRKAHNMKLSDYDWTTS